MPELLFSALWYVKNYFRKIFDILNLNFMYSIHEELEKLNDDGSWQVYVRWPITRSSIRANVFSIEESA